MKKSIVLTLTTIIAIALLSSIVLATELNSSTTTPANPGQNNNITNNINNPQNIVANSITTNTLTNTANTITPSSNTVTDNTITYIPGGDILTNNITTDLYNPEQDTPNTENAESDLTQTPTNVSSVNTASNSNEMGIDTIVNILMTVVGLVIILLGFAILIKSK